MQISAEKTKLMTKVNGQKREAVTSFKYPGSVITDEGSKPGVPSTITQKQQNWQGSNQFGMTEVFLSVPRYD